MGRGSAQKQINIFWTRPKTYARPAPPDLEKPLLLLFWKGHLPINPTLSALYRQGQGPIFMFTSIE